MPDFNGFKFDRSSFFEQFRKEFGAIPADRQYVVDGLNRLLTGFETYYGWWDDIRQIANAFAQVGWETAWSYTPVVEGYYLGDPKKPGYFSGNTATVLRVQRGFWYWPHFGRGDIQTTHEENYLEAEAYIRKYFPERVRDFESRTGQTFDLKTKPEQLLDGWLSFCGFTVGMHLGLYRAGQTLDRYISPTRCDHYAAREIVNGDKSKVKRGQKSSIGRQIESVAMRFERILTAASVTDTLAEISDDEINIFAEQITEAPATRIGAAEPNITDGGDLAPSVAAPGAGADLGPASGEAPAPPAEPTKFFSIEDWKPWAVRWSKRIWTGVSTMTLPTGGGLTLAAISDSSNWYIYAAIAAVLLVLIVGVGIIATVVVAGIWLFQNRHIPEIKREQMRTFADPSLTNFDLTFERK